MLCQCYVSILTKEISFRHSVVIDHADFENKKFVRVFNFFDHTLITAFDFIIIIVITVTYKSLKIAKKGDKC